jgi:uncharacterized membrane protein
MSQDNPVVTSYLATLDRGLSDLTVTDREEVIRDIRSHISEAVGSGKPLEQVLASLGPPEGLARAYSVELLLKRPQAFKTRRNRMLRLVGLVIVGGIPTLVAVIVLGVVGVVLSFTGIVLFVAGRAALAETLPWWVSMDADPRLAIVLGPILSAVGLGLLAALWLYFRVAAGVVRRVLPPRQE